MKLKIPIKKRVTGSVLIVTLIICSIMTITLASYLTMTLAQEKSVRRSQGWNAAIAISEAGIEDAMCHLNSSSWAQGQFAANGYALKSDGSYAVTRYLNGGYYTVTISVPSGSYPIVTSYGYNQLLASEFASAPTFAAIGAQTQPSFVGRKIKVTTKKDALLNVTMAAKRTINFSGNNVSTDSFDSADPLYNTGGLYDKTKTKANGDVITDSTITNDFNVGNANIKGTIRTGPHGVPYLGPNASVGDSTWVSSAKPGIQPGHFYDDMNVVWPDVTLPAGAYLPALTVSTNIGGKTYKYYLTTGKWQINDMSGSIYVDGDAVVYVPPTGKISLSGQDSIYINAPAGRTTSMTIYAGVASASLGGQGIVNSTGNAINFIYYGLPSNTSLSFSANAAFVGTVYAPEAAFTLGGGGKNTYDFVGASVSDTIKMNGSFAFHYDENLRRVGPGRGYVPTSWAEM